MTALQPYSRYEPSGVEWLPSIPSGWSVGRLKHLVDKIPGGTPDTDNLEYWCDPHDGVPWVSIGDMSRRSEVWETKKSISSAGLASKRLRVSKPGTILFAMYASVGEVAILRVPATWNQAILGLRPRRDLAYGPFIYYALLGLKPRLAQMFRSNTQNNLNAEQVGALDFALPPLTEQRQIASFLDQETARIDKLIDKQRQLIEKLNERRLAVITSALSEFPVSDAWKTGSSWYPSLPSDWQIGRVKSVARRVTDGAHISPDTEGGVYDFVSTRDIRRGEIDFAGALKTTPETYEYMVRTGCQPRAGDVLYSKDGTVGETALVRQDLDFVVASSLVIVTPDRMRVDSDFLSYVFASKTAREQAASLMRGAGLPRLSVANLARIEVPLPPLEEQRRIVTYLDEKTSKLDELREKARRCIELSQERRAALVSAAVTGQIDVRATSEEAA